MYLYEFLIQKGIRNTDDIIKYLPSRITYSELHIPWLVILTVSDRIDFDKLFLDL